MLYYNWILNISDKKLHENTAEAIEYIICKHSATGCYDTILWKVSRIIRSQFFLLVASVS
jgi:hypothetical protein